MSDLLLPLPQSGEYARALDLLGVPVRTLRQTCGGQDRLLWQVQSRRFGPLGRVDMISRGPVAHDPAVLRDWLFSHRRWQDDRPLLLNAPGIGAQDLRAAGFWPLYTPGSVAILPLGAPAQMRAAMAQKWRNRLHRAERAGLSVRTSTLKGPHRALEDEAAQARARGYRGLPPGLTLAFARATPGSVRLWEVWDHTSSTRLACVVVLRHGRMATWQMGHVLPEGRRCCAMNLALWSAMRWLAEVVHDQLDLGVINSDDAGGLAHFKLGTSAQVERLGGTWLHLGALAPIARRLPARLAA